MDTMTTCLAAGVTDAAVCDLPTAAITLVAPDDATGINNREASASRKSWCESKDPEFAAKAADVVGLYMAPPSNALVIPGTSAAWG